MTRRQHSWRTKRPAVKLPFCRYFILNGRSSACRLLSTSSLNLRLCSEAYWYPKTSTEHRSSCGTGGGVRSLGGQHSCTIQSHLGCLASSVLCSPPSLVTAIYLAPSSIRSPDSLYTPCPPSFWTRLHVICRTPPAHSSSDTTSRSRPALPQHFFLKFENRKVTIFIVKLGRIAVLNIFFQCQCYYKALLKV